MQDKETVDFIVYTCVILHNMVGENDGIFKEWNYGMRYGHKDGRHESETVRSIFKNQTWYNRFTQGMSTEDLRDLDLSGMLHATEQFFGDYITIEEEDVSQADAQNLLRHKLVDHYAFLFSKQLIQWPVRLQQQLSTLATTWNDELANRVRETLDGNRLLAEWREEEET